MLTTLTDYTEGAESNITDNKALQLTVIFNNVPYVGDLTDGWGFSCFIEGPDNTILFDTGSDGNVLLSNMHYLGIDPKQIDSVVLSHIHGDHTGGLNALLNRNSDVTVHMPASFPSSFKQDVKRAGARIETVHGARQLFDNVYSTGEMGRTIKEQALILNTPQGLVIITGCAHPNVAKIAAAAKNYLRKHIYLLMGGFHLLGISDNGIHEIITEIKELGVMKVAPSHCTGDKAIALFRDAWGDDFIEGGLGAIIHIPR